MSRLHDCRHETPLAVDYQKLPTTAECEEPHCYWQRYASENSVESMLAVRSSATHHAKALRHRVLVHLRQDLHLTPQGTPLAVGAQEAAPPVPKAWADDLARESLAAYAAKYPHAAQAVQEARQEIGKGRADGAGWGGGT